MSSFDCKRRLRMRSPPPTAATMRTRRTIEAMTCRELPAAAMRPPSRSVEVLSRDDEAGAILQSNSCRRTVKRNVSLNAQQILSHTDLTVAKIRAQNEPVVDERFAERKQPSDPLILCSKLPKLQQEAESSRMSMLAKVSLRENSLVFFGAELPMLQQVTTGTDKFFYHRAVGWFVG